MIDIANALIMGLGACVGAYIIHIETRMVEFKKKQNELLNVVTKFPTPQEMAKIILTTKFPIDELPEEMRNKIMTQESGKLHKKSDYIG